MRRGRSGGLGGRWGCGMSDTLYLATEAGTVIIFAALAAALFWWPRAPIVDVLDRVTARLAQAPFLEICRTAPHVLRVSSRGSLGTVRVLLFQREFGAGLVVQRADGVLESVPSVEAAALRVVELLTV